MTVTCIIPCFNEIERVAAVLNEVVKVSLFSEIILVDDGSTDGTREFVQKNYPQVTCISNEINMGKSESVKVGLTHARGTYVTLLDADLSQLRYADLNHAITAIMHDPSIDMIILRRVNAPFIVRLTRADVLIPGERILKKKDLHQVLNHSAHNPRGFQIEYAINQYMINNKKNVYWTPSSAVNTWPTEKQGFIRGLWVICAMQLNILIYIGIKNFIYQYIFFGKQQLSTVQSNFI